MNRRTLPREPYRGGQICGYQEEYSVLPGRLVFCGEFKEPGLYFCQYHHDWMQEAWGAVRIAWGNAKGLRLAMSAWGWSVYDGDGLLCASANERGDLVDMYGFTLQWEGEDSEPIAATPEEVKSWENSAT